MILSDLYDLYKLKRESEPEAMPERYWCRKAVSWEIVLGHSGIPVSVISLAGEGDGAPKTLEVPDVQRTSGIRPFFLCDNAEYLLGCDEKRGKQKQEQFISLHREILKGVDDLAARALLLFLEKIEAGQGFQPLASLKDNPKALAVFRLADEDAYVHDHRAIRLAWSCYRESQEQWSNEGTCLVTGRVSHFAKLFPQVTGLPGAQSAGASLVSCNADAFCSYGQKISTVGAISCEAADKAGFALSYVLKNREHRLRMGSDYIAFWTDAADPGVDKGLAFFLDPESLMVGEDESAREAVRTSLVELRKGNPPVTIPEGTSYHLLGIAPYQARLAVRFYESGSLGELQDNIVQFLKDTELEGVNPCSMRSYLEQTAAQGEARNLPSTLVTSCVRAMVHGRPFPAALMQRILARTRIDHGTDNPRLNVGRRAAILKACLLRAARARGVDQGEEMERSLNVGLNYENTNQGYLLGRLFALLEKAQRDAIGGANATIRDRFMGAAATTPARVFPQLLKLAQHHISKSEFGGLVDRQIQEVIGVLGDGGFPKTLTFDEQGLFYIGYYQQRQVLFTARTNNSSIESKEG